MARINWCQKFQLLLWKNWKIEMNHKCQFTLELLLPVLFTMILMTMRAGVAPKRESEIIFDPVSISDLGLLYQSLSLITFTETQFNEDALPNLRYTQQSDPYAKKILPYSPKNQFIRQIMEQAASSLGLEASGYINAEELIYELTVNSHIAGVQFDDSMERLEKFPEKISFSLRFPGELRTGERGRGTSWQTFRLFPLESSSFPRNYNDTDGGVPAGYVREGFIAIQNAISRAFISLKSGKKDIPKVEIRRFPYPPFMFDPLLFGLRGIIPLLVVLAFIFPCTCMARDVAYEKEKQLKEVMKIMGLPNMLHWAAWFVRGLVILVLASSLMQMILMGKFIHEVAVLTFSDWTVVFAFFFIYCITSICFVFMLTVFFSKASTAAAASGLIWFITHLPYMLLMESYAGMPRAAKLAWCLISNSAVAFGLDVILGFEGTGEGQHWKNLFDPVNMDNHVSLGEIMGMMILSSLIYLAICLYVEQVFPGEFGMPRKWNFVFTRKFWCNESKYINRESDFATSKMQRQSMRDYFEVEPRNKTAGLQIINLNKKFGNFWAVKNLSLNMFEDEITVLLGHNGAGKTTTISMLTGLYPPTSGTAIVSGYDIRTDIDGARASLGICPQYNVLFDDLSVSNHIKFFCMLRGIDKKNIKREIRKYLRLIDIEKKANTPSSKLSGGMQRKLSVCCALCGDTKVVLCDEPSSGMDPSARRHLWNLLQAEKAGRTVLLTTHFMDEADVLGDRIAIMSAGQLKCCGSAFFLKKKFGTGYRLTCVKREDCDPVLVTALLRQYIPDIKLPDDLGAELSYELPYKDSKVFEQMLGVLEENSSELGLNGYGISITSMEEVFMKVGAENIAPRKSVILNLTQKDIYEDDPSETSLDSHYTFDHTDSLRSRKRNVIFNQFHAMFLKKILYTWRKKLLFIMQNLIPIYFVVTAVFIARSLVIEALPPLLISLENYDFATTVLEVNPVAVQSSNTLNDIGKAYETIAKSFGPKYTFVSTKGEPFETYMLRLGETKQVLINQRYMVAATVNADSITAWFNNQALHTAPLAVNMVNNAIARVLIGPDAEIDVTNEPLKRSASARIRSIESGESLGGQVASNICFCMSFLSSLYVLFLVKENTSKAKLLQYVAGVKIWIFWLTHLLWDMFTFTISALVLIVALACFQEKYFREFDNLMKILLLIFVFGLAALPLTYLLSNKFREPATAFARISTLNIFLGMALYICVMVMSFPMFETKDIADKMVYIFMFYPHFALAFGINELYANLVTSDLCDSDTLKKMTRTMVCQTVPQCCEETPIFGFKRPGILWEFVYMLSIGGIFILFLFMREYRWVREYVLGARMCKRKKRRPPPKDENIDSDIEAEKRRIAVLDIRKTDPHKLVLDRVTKYYGEFLAVNQISFCVKHKECFGLLGVNGAGKTTTFKMLTGDEKLTYGNAYVKGHSIRTSMNKVYKQIGYCPQFDALLEDLTGREVLRIFCLLKNVSKDRIMYLSEELAHSFGFTKHLDKAVRKYSGGNKRKLSVALAVIGKPSVIYLDEPTTGMDPAARRRLWNVVCMLRDMGKAIVLTSHSMEECEALCTRLAIMVNGELKCIGSIQHLKNKFSKGFILKIKVQSEFVKEKNRPSSRRSIKPDKSSTDVVEPIVEDVVEDVVQSSETKITESDGKRDTEEEELHTSSSDEVVQEMRRVSFGGKALNTSMIRQAYSNILTAYIQDRFPSAYLQDNFQGMLTYTIPISDVKWSEIFGFMERNLTKLNIEDYAITQTTLEEIFLDFAKKQIDVRVHSHRKGCRPRLKLKQCC